MRILTRSAVGQESPAEKVESKFALRGVARTLTAERRRTAGHSADAAASFSQVRRPGADGLAGPVMAGTGSSDGPASKGVSAAPASDRAASEPGQDLSNERLEHHHLVAETDALLIACSHEAEPGTCGRRVGAMPYVIAAVAAACVVALLVGAVSGRVKVRSCRAPATRTTIAGSGGRRRRSRTGALSPLSIGSTPGAPGPAAPQSWRHRRARSVHRRLGVCRLAQLVLSSLSKFPVGNSST